MKAYRQELIQVAAVAVAMIEDLDTGSADRTSMAAIVGEVMQERLRQDEKWGPQHHDIPMWLTILMEEVGEASQAFLHVLEDLTPGDIDG